ncbi:hypothetical protein B3286c2_1030 [Brucella vulpis]|nr:hypothetical protein BF3285c2_1034 [Brucella vulpis]CUW52037.1 hypothetical protein B3286c2_1030 [Brucella vulpis]
MIDLRALANPGRPLQLLCLGAHSDDIEIGCGGTLLHLIETGTPLHVEWCVLSGNEQRRAEAEASARDFLLGMDRFQLHVASFADSYFPAESRAIKEWLIAQRGRGHPDIGVYPLPWRCPSGPQDGQRIDLEPCSATSLFSNMKYPNGMAILAGPMPIRRCLPRSWSAR